MSRQHILFGLDVAAELLRSKGALTSILNTNVTVSYTYQASGQTYLNNPFLNFSPFAGLDLACRLKAEEKSSATDLNGITYETTVDRRDSSFGFRPRLQLAATYQNVGLFASYSVGQVNYLSGYAGGTTDCTSRLLRFGLSYRFLTIAD